MGLARNTPSVVADEVRKLAERSSSATKEIAKILGAIKRETVRRRRGDAVVIGICF